MKLIVFNAFARASASILIFSFLPYFFCHVVLSPGLSSLSSAVFQLIKVLHNFQNIRRVYEQQQQQSSILILSLNIVLRILSSYSFGSCHLMYRRGWWLWNATVCIWHRWWEETRDCKGGNVSQLKYHFIFFKVYLFDDRSIQHLVIFLLFSRILSL